MIFVIGSSAKYTHPYNLLILCCYYLSWTDKAVIKPTLKRLQEVVLDPMRAMDEQFKKVLDLQTTVEKETAVSKTLKKTVTAVARNLWLREKELGVLQQRSEQQMTEHKQRVPHLHTGTLDVVWTTPITIDLLMLQSFGDL